MIGEILAFVVGACVASVVTANVYRSSQAASTRKAIAGVQRYLNVDEDKPLEKLTAKLKFYLESINEADDLVARSEWAKKHKNRFVAQSIRIITLRNKGVAKEDKQRLIESQKAFRESGEMLMGYFQFPSWLWLKATFARMKSGAKQKRALKKKKPSPEKS